MVRKKVEQTEVVRIAEGLLRGVKEFLETEPAKRLGLLSYADVINESVKDLLRKYKMLP
jgi:hypothetical protein